MRRWSPVVLPLVAAVFLGGNLFAQEEKDESKRRELRERVLQKVDSKLTDEATRLKGEIAKLVDEELARVPKKDEPKPEKAARHQTLDGTGWLGLAVEPLKPALQELAGLKEGEGLLVTSVVPKGPAAQAGLEANDIVVTLDGRSVGSPEALINLVKRHRPGDEVVLSVLRKKAKQQITVTLGARPGAPAPAAPMAATATKPAAKEVAKEGSHEGSHEGGECQDCKDKGAAKEGECKECEKKAAAGTECPDCKARAAAQAALVAAAGKGAARNDEEGAKPPRKEAKAGEFGWLGAQLAPLPEDSEVEGVLIQRVLPNGPAAKAGLKEKDVIVAAQGKEVGHPAQLLDLLKKTHPGDPLKLAVLRGGKGDKQNVTVTLSGRPGDQTPGPVPAGREVARAPKQDDGGTKADELRARMKKFLDRMTKEEQGGGEPADEAAPRKPAPQVQQPGGT